MMWVGSITIPHVEAAIQLAGLGVRIGAKSDIGWYNCEMSEETFAQLAGLWGVFYWSLVRKEAKE